jgi:hypothetical protein
MMPRGSKIINADFRRFTICLMFLAVVLTAVRAVAGLTWPADQFLPTFASPAATIDCVSMDGLPTTQQALFVSLEGVVNRTRPQMACVSAASEGAFTWLAIHGLPYDTINGFSAILKYETNVTGLVVNDPAQPHTLNLATTIAGVKDELVCDPSLLETLTNSPYNLPVKDDLRGMFSNKYQVYGYLYTNYWPLCTHRVIAGLQTNNYWYLRDYLVAVKSAVVWLDPSVSADANTLKSFTTNMTPVNGIYLGWWPNESSDLQWIAQYGIPVLASDLFDNGSVYGGVTTPIAVPPIPPPPPLQNKVYVSITLSDGDNVQYMQHTMKMNWGSAARGTVPIGWTVQPLLADFDPGMLNSFWSTATTNDCLVAGPSGAGYTRINYWSAGNIAAYTKASNPYLQRTGIRTITVWLNLSGTTGSAYATNCPTLVGVNDQSDGYYTTLDGTLPVIGFPSSANYAITVSNLLYGITNTAATWTGLSPMFIAVQARSWGITPADCQTVMNSLDPAKYVVVRPDHLFLLYKKAAGLGQGGAVPYVATQPASQLASVGTNVTFNVIATGTAPLIYQWRMNETNIPGATNSIYTRSSVQLSDTGSYQVVVANAYGFVTSSVATLTFGNQPLGFNGNGLNWTVNQNSNYYVYSTPAIAGNLLTLTDDGGSEARSFFFNHPQYIGAFKTAFTYQVGGSKSADGASFCLQNDSRSIAALGGGGGQLGVGTANPITPSIELELNLFTGGGQNMGYTVLTNGLTGAVGGNGNYHAPGSVNLKSGDPISIAMNYANGQMNLTFTDAVARTSFATNLNVGDLTRIMGTNIAFVGFTGADGGSTSIQTISNFSFVSIPPVAIQSNGTNVLISWPVAAPGYTMQQNSDLTTTHWMNVTNQNLLTNGLNQVTMPLSRSNQFYRLVLPPPP